MGPIIGPLAGVVAALTSGVFAATSATTSALGIPAPVVGGTHWGTWTSTPANPRHNIAPSPSFAGTCATNGGNNAKCIRLAVKAIEHARSHEHMKKIALILPDNFRKLSVAKQTFVLTDLERVDRGLRPYAGLTSRLNSVAHTAAVGRTDPSLATALMHASGVREYGSVWAGDFGPLASDYDWMYNDGYSSSGSTNVDCATPQASTCWGHRDNILYRVGSLSVLSAGAGTSKPDGFSIAEILVSGNGNRPAFTYTWKQALAHGADGHPVARSTTASRLWR